MKTFHNIASETETILINRMAEDVRRETDLADEGRVIADLKNKDWSAAMIDDYLDAVIERARILKQSEPLRDASTGIASFLKMTAAVLPAAAAWYGLWCILPDPAQAMTLDDAKGVMMRGLYVLCAMLVFAVALWLSALVLFRKDAEDAEYDTYDTGDIERRRRNAGGE